VPKYLTLRLEPASGSSLPPKGGSPITQSLWLTNSQQGAKDLAVRLRLGWTDAAGSAHVEQVTVDKFPAGL
jgi:AP-1 complex subunit gamma-1